MLSNDSKARRYLANLDYVALKEMEADSQVVSQLERQHDPISLESIVTIQRLKFVPKVGCNDLVACFDCHCSVDGDD